MKPLLAPFGTGLCPIPSALLTFRTDAGAAQVMAAAWVGVICSRPAILSVTLKRRSSDAAGFPAGGEFAVNLPSEEQLASRPFLDLLALDEGGGSGLNLRPGARVAAPVIAECPVRIECRGATFFSRFGQELVSGEVAAVSMEGRTYGLEGPVDLCRLKPFSGPFAAARKAGFEGIIPLGLEAATLGVSPG